MIVGWNHHHYEQANVTQLSNNSSLFCRGGMSSRTMQGQQSHQSPASVRDLRLTCSEFTGTAISIAPLLTTPPPIFLPNPLAFTLTRVQIQFPLHSIDSAIL